MWRWFAIVLGIGITTAIAGEIKVSPFINSFRVSLGSAVFFFLILFYKPCKLPVVGALVGVVVCLFRVMLDAFFAVNYEWYFSWTLHVPAIFYYITFANLLAVFQYKRLTSSPILFGLVGAVVDSTSNVIELLTRVFVDEWLFQLGDRLPVIITVGILRSFLVVGIYMMFEIRELQIISRIQQQRMEKLLFILSELHEGRLYLQKMMSQVEQITAQSYHLYRRMSEEERATEERATEVLMLAEEIHEVKKDAQRIYASLSRLLKQEKVADHLSIKEIVQLVARANGKYAEMLDKTVVIETKISIDFQTNMYISILSILNNLVSNAVEAIPHSGVITIGGYSTGECLQFSVQDDGPGIDSRDQEVIFDPGFTTKFDQGGNASTGIGLSHVTRTLKELKGTIEVGKSTMGGCNFEITIPVASLLVHSPSQM